MVDDDDEDVYSMRRAFRTLSEQVTFVSFSDGHSLFELLERSDDEENDTVIPDPILLDLNLPTISGYDILERLRTGSRPNLIPVIIFSTSDAEADAIRCYRGGANAVFTKPASYEGTLLIAEAVTSFWQTAGIKRVGKINPR